MAEISQPIVYSAAHTTHTGNGANAHRTLVSIVDVTTMYAIEIAVASRIRTQSRFEKYLCVSAEHALPMRGEKSHPKFFSF